MAKKFLTPISILNLASDPALGVEGDIYYNTTSDVLRIYSNSQWLDVSANGVTNIDGGFASSVYGGIDGVDGGTP